MELEVWETCTNPHVCINIELIPLEWTQIVSIISDKVLRAGGSLKNKHR